jgi:hypothetical protein
MGGIAIKVLGVAQSGTGVDDNRVDFTYAPVEQFEFISRYSDLAGNNLVANTTYTYNDHNRLDRLGHSNGSSEVAFYDFAYDDRNLLTQVTDPLACIIHEDIQRASNPGLWTIRVKEEEESGRGYKTLRSTTDVNPS